MVMNFAGITKLIQADLTLVKDLIQANCSSQVPLINTVALHLANNAGKMLRPIVTILCAKIAGLNNNAHIQIAAALEMLHTATLLHDDIVDNANLRRGNITANYSWGNDVAVLAGDFLLAKAAHNIAVLNNPTLSAQLTNAMCSIAEGEVLQLLNKNNVEISQDTYLQIIAKKTASLFIMAATLPAILNNCDPEIIEHLASYGKHLGIAFQLIDDLLDYQVEHNNTGKNIGADLQEGKITMPVINLLSLGNAKDKQLLQRILETQDLKLLPELQTAIAKTGAIAYTKSLAEQEIAQAKLAISKVINDSAYKKAAVSLLDFIIARNY